MKVQDDAVVNSQTHQNPNEIVFAETLSFFLIREREPVASVKEREVKVRVLRKREREEREREKEKTHQNPNEIVFTQTFSFFLDGRSYRVRDVCDLWLIRLM